MTTSDPQADRRDDEPREHRSIGQRIRDAVLGDPDDDRRDAPTETGYADRREGEYADPPRGDVGTAPGDDERGRTAGENPDRYGAAHAETAQAGAQRTDPDRGYSDPDTTYADRVGAPGADAGDNRGRDDLGAGGLATGQGYADPDRGDVSREAGYADPGRGDAGREGGYADTQQGGVQQGEVGRDADREYAPYEQAMREHVQSGAVPDPVRDDVTQEGTARPVDDRAGYSDRDVPAAPDARTGYDDTAARADTAYADTRPADRADTAAAPAGRDFTTSSYDPDRDSGYDPQAAGTAMTGGAAGAAVAGAARDRDPRDGDLRDDVRGDQAYDAPATDTRAADDRSYDTRGYDPATDTGYPDEGRVDTDRATGNRDADYDTGRVDTGPVDTGGGYETDRDDAQRVGTDDRGSWPAAAGVGGALAGGGAAAAAGVAAHRRQDDDRGDGRFSEVDDTATVEPTSTGQATPDTAGATAGTTADTAADRRAEAVADEAQESDESGGDRERLVPAGRAHDYSSRWDALKGDFVDEPRRAVTQADQLVGEVLDDIQRLFTDQRRELDEGFDRDQASTEDLRLALRRYRSFFDRLLSL